MFVKNITCRDNKKLDNKVKYCCVILIIFHASYDTIQVHIYMYCLDKLIFEDSQAHT